jgi:hypothetical protein
MFTKGAIALSVAIILGAASVAPAMSASSTGRSAKGAQSFAQSTQINDRRHSSNRAFDVFATTGRYLGSDPDPRVRSQLLLDQHEY